jgi:YVTN family beta-propeller protein
MSKRLALGAIYLALLVAGACAEDDSSGTARRVVTADWLNQSLTVLDYSKLVDGRSEAAEAILDTIDLSAWEPGPIEVELTPDGRTAVVSIGPAFFDGLPSLVGRPEIAPGGTLLIVDLESGAADEIGMRHVPLGIAVSPDGTRAYSANYGTEGARGNTLSVIDIPGRRLVEEIEVGGGPEQVALSPDGTLGIVNVVSRGGIRTFRTSDVAATMSEVLPTGSDPSDVSFLNGNDRAVVANTFGFDVTLIDTSDPSSPSVIASVPLEIGVPYGLTYVPSRDEILAAMGETAPGVPTNLVTIGLDGDVLTPAAPAQLGGENFPLGVAVDSEGAFAFVAHIVDHRLSIVELATARVRSIDWLAGPGPSYVAVQP